MRARLVSDKDGERTFVLVFAEDDEVVGELKRFARENNLVGSQYTAIGAFREVLLGWFDPEARKYEEIPVPEQVEVLTLNGDICAGEKGPSVHAHAVLGRRDGSAVGGHLLAGRVRPTLEMVLTELPVNLQKRHDPKSGLVLMYLP
ncbi:MAG: PPC domain-containing DNA-binding protein [Planctomycetota bacterium]